MTDSKNSRNLRRAIERGHDLGKRDFERRKGIMTIKDQIESEPLNIHGSSLYARQRGYTDALLSYHIEGGDRVTACRQYLAASRRAMLHSLEDACCPGEIIEAIFSPCTE